MAVITPNENDGFSGREVILVASPGSRTGSEHLRMANIQSQKKRNRQNEKRRVRNKGVRSELKTRVKAAAQAVADGGTDTADVVKAAQKRIDKAGAKGVIHKNAAARRTSRLMKRAAKSG
jgi:small subunit ribosomal protein S20